MRAAERPHVADSAQREPNDLVMLVVATCLVVSALLWIWTPTVLRAQSTPVAADVQQAGTFVVQKRAGETLHEIALRFYGDSTAWKQIAASNGFPTNNRRLLIKVGTQLRLPGKTPADVAAVMRGAPGTPPAALPAAPVRPTSSLAVQTGGKADADSAAARAAAAQRAQAALDRPPLPAAAAARPTPVLAADAATRAANDSAAARAAIDERPMARLGGTRIGMATPQEARIARGREAPTVFMGQQYNTEREMRDVVAAAQLQSRAAAPRHGEYAAAPFPLPSQRFVDAGKVLRRLNGADVTDRDLPRNVRLTDEVTLTLPVGMTAAVGQQFMTIHRGPAIGTAAHIAVPTGILQVTRADAGHPVIARLVRQSGIVEEGQLIVAAEGTAAPATVRAVPTDDVIRGSVHFVLGDQVLPSIQTYLVLDATESQGVRQGDEFWLVERIGTGDDAREQRIAVARIVRTTPYGSSAIVIHQDRAGIAVGAAVRRAARAADSAGQ
jgi:hypothetical protein